MKQKGFNLIELLVVVAIIGIVSTVAYPAYTDYVRTTRRADAKAALLTLANAMERNHSVADTYAGLGKGGDGNGEPKTSVYTVPPGIAAYYKVEITASDATTFALSATPGGAQADDACGKLTVTESGLTGADADGCW